MTAGVEYALTEIPLPNAGYTTTGELELHRRHARRRQNSITVALGADVTCTIVNTDDTPTLTLVKTVTNDDGGTKRSPTTT